MKIGLIGLGHMGSEMARNLLKAGYELTVYDIVPASLQALVNAGAAPAKHIAEMAAQAEVIITMVQTSEQVHDLCLSSDGIFNHAKPDTLYIDNSSIDIVMTRTLHEEAAGRQIVMLDAPVSGGVAGAEAGTLTFMAGGSEQAFLRAKPIFSAMGRKIIHAGPAGSGQAAKICNNLILGISMIGVSEAFTLAKKLGLDQKKFYEISSNASGQCWSMVNNCPAPDIIANVPANVGYEPGFMAKMMLKDLRLAHHAAEAVDAVIPLGAVATELYELFVNQGYGELDFSGIIKLIAAERM